MKDQMEHMENVTQGLMQACDEVNSGCCKSVDALVEATSMASKGCEEFSRNLGSLVQESVARAIGASKTMLAARNFQTIAETQNELMQSLLDSWIVGAGKLSQISVRVTQDALEPVMKHANDALSDAARRAQQGKAAA